MNEKCGTCLVFSSAVTRICESCVRLSLSESVCVLALSGGVIEGRKVLLRVVVPHRSVVPIVLYFMSTNTYASPVGDVS